MGKYQPRGGRIDANQSQIVRELRSLGYKVDLVSQLKRLYDLVVTGRIFGTDEIRTVRVEVKQKGESLSPAEKLYHESEPYPQTLIIAYCTEDVLKWFEEA